MAKELDCSADFLVNEAMRQYAKSRSDEFPEARKIASPPWQTPQQNHERPDAEGENQSFSNSPLGSSPASQQAEGETFDNEEEQEGETRFSHQEPIALVSEQNRTPDAESDEASIQKPEPSSTENKLDLKTKVQSPSKDREPLPLEQKKGSNKSSPPPIQPRNENKPGEQTVALDPSYKQEPSQEQEGSNRVTVMPTLPPSEEQRPSSHSDASLPPPLPGSVTDRAKVGSLAQGQQTIYMIFDGRKIPIEKDEFVIGRSAKNSDFAIRDANISRRHAKVVFQDHQYRIKDLGSTNGIEFKGNRVFDHVIHEGEEFRLCNFKISFTYEN